MRIVPLLGLVATVVVASLAEASGLPRPFREVPKGVALPSYVLEEMQEDGSVVERGMIEYRGDPIVLVFWATWCGVCARELPKLDQLQADFDARLRIVALSIDDGGIRVPAGYLHKNDLLHLRPYLDSQKGNATALGVRGVPATFVADSAGRILAEAIGPVPWGAPSIRRYLDSIVGPQGTQPAGAE